MKKTFILTLMTVAAVQAQTQSIETARQAMYNERYQTAEDQFGKLIAQDKYNEAAWYGLAKAHLLQNEVKNAADTLQLAPAEVQQSRWGKLAMGTVAAYRGEATADGYFEQVLKETKEKDAAVLAAVAEAQLISKSGDAGKAVELLNKAIRRNKDDATLYVLLGDAYRKMHNGSEAYKAYKQALEKDNNHAAAHHRLGEIFLSQKNAELYLPYFNAAVAADPNYAPSLYQLYAYEFYHNPAKAMEYYKRYVANADASLRNAYDLADLLYLNKQYGAAIAKASELIAAEGNGVQPRMYKLIGYSYAEQKDSAKALDYMQQYFAKAPDSLLIAKDFETISTLLLNAGQDSLATTFLVKAAEQEKDSVARFAYYRQLANIAKQRKDYAAQAQWMERYYTHNEKATNQDLYYWALAHYLAGDYVKADTVFGMYVAKYPEQSFGYYWQAKSKALQDKEMESGLAIPAYQKLIEVLDSNKTDPNYKKWMVEAYGYLAAYEANALKDYAEAKALFEKVLQVEPENEDARKYIAVLEKQIAKGS